MRNPLLLFLLFSFPGFSQLSFNDRIELGSILNAYEIKGDLVIKNNNDKKTFLMRADADKGVKIYTSKKTLLPGDTCLIIISFIPESKGAFKKSIRLVASDREKPYNITLSGNVQNVVTDDKTACYYFGNRKPPVLAKKEAIFVPQDDAPRDASNKIPDNPSEPVVTVKEKPEPPVQPDPPPPPPRKEPSDFSEEFYVPNNIIFLVDVSGSMKDSLKLPLMKLALHHLIDQIRDVDRLTFITYADTIKILKEAANAEQRKDLHAMVDALKAKGMTKGRKAILFSQQVAQNNFIEGGNNQIIIATDGIFKFESEDQKLWNQRQGNKKIVLSTVAFGEDKDAIKNLRELARKGKGSFIKIENKQESRSKLMNEIKNRSKK